MLKRLTPINILIAILVVLSVPVIARVVTGMLIVPNVDAVSARMQAVLILGASVNNGKLSETLQERADTAIAIYNAKKAKKILISGDGRTPSYDEVGTTRDYLVQQGIPPADIFLDRRGLDTYSSLYRASYVYGTKSLIITTQDYHLPRALALAWLMGIHATGVKAEGDSAFGYAREIPATWKALWDWLRGREPMFLGAPVPLVGNGATTTR